MSGFLASVSGNEKKTNNEVSNCKDLVKSTV